MMLRRSVHVVVSLTALAFATGCGSSESGLPCDPAGPDCTQSSNSAGSMAVVDEDAVSLDSELRHDHDDDDGDDGERGANAFCQPCSHSSECGGRRNFCLRGVDGHGFCGSDCSRASCAEGSYCARIRTRSGWIVGYNCVPEQGYCSASHPGDAGTPPPHPADAGTPHPSDAGTPHPADAGTPIPPACTPDTWANYAQAFFSNNCATCHGARFSDYATVTSNSGVKSRISNGSMPPAGLSSSEKQRILTWFNCGAPK